jgi:general stress protein YciG
MTFSRTDLSKYLAKLGRKGGKARLTTMTAEERREIASKGGKASGIARRANATAKKH